jgi:DNA-directed RNA polymerase specialized sigma subunit
MSDIEEASKALTASRNMNIAPFNPQREVETSLVHLLQHKIKKIEDDDTYESELKAAMIARLPEASFSEIAEALRNQQASSNTGMEKILAPFIPKMGERIPLLDDNKTNRDSDNEELFNTANKETLQALNELTRAITLTKEITQKDLEAANIKTTLGITESDK